MIFARFSRIAAMALLISTIGVSAPAQASSAANDQDKAVEAVRQMFVALTNDDAALFNSVTSADFYAFDVGKRFDGNALLQLVKQAHAAGKIYEWKVTEPEVRVDGSTALVTYVNQGSLKSATDLTQLSWLESAVIRKEGGEWRIHFFHSTRVPSE